MDILSRLRVALASRYEILHELGRGGIGARLGVAFVVDGSVQRDQRRLRVTLRLVRADDARSLWAETFDDDSGDPIANAQRVVVAAAGTIANVLKASNGRSEIGDRRSND